VTATHENHQQQGCQRRFHRAQQNIRPTAPFSCAHRKLIVILARMLTIDLTDDELVPVVAVLRIARDGYPHAPRMATLRDALAKLDPSSVPKLLPERVPLPKAPTRSRGGRRARR
jgi:hypothetical protein